VTVKEVSHIRCFAIDIAKDFVLLSRLLAMEELVQHFVSPEHSLDDIGRSKIYIIDHNPSWKEIQRQKKREFLDPRVTNITSGGHKQKGYSV
jgi:hypothetical protein